MPKVQGNVKGSKTKQASRQWTHDETVTLIQHWADEEIQRRLEGNHQNIDYFPKTGA